ncbi:MAG: FkbM family methyltransferase [Acidobacteriaceae bacterium]
MSRLNGTSVRAASILKLNLFGYLETYHNPYVFCSGMKSQAVQIKNLEFIDTKYIRQVGVYRWLTRYSMRQFTKRVLKRDNRMRLPTGSSILLPRWSTSATSVYVTKAHIDWGAEELFSQFASKDGDFMDVGAHIGYYSMYMHPLARKVYAFEPDPRNLPDLHANAASVGNIEVVNKAVSSHSGTALFYVGGDSTLSTLEMSEGATVEGETVEVQTISIDDFAAGRPGIKPTLFKIDAEGHDFEVLLGMKKTVATHQPIVLIECNSGNLLDLCDEWQYSIFTFTCDRETFKMTFRQIRSLEDFQKYWTNMLFLTPRHLRATFVDRCS